VKAFVLALVPIAAFAFAAGDQLTPLPVTASRSHLPVATVSQDSPSDEDVDAYGNEVTDAIAEYSLDPAGSRYEVHSPQIELPRLGSPKS